MNQNFYEAVEDNPIIAAVKSMEDVEECCKHDDIRVIFILFGDVCSIGSIVKTIRDAGKIAMVHMDLISGLSPKEIAVEFIKEQTEADGIISTKPSLIKKAKEMSSTNSILSFSIPFTASVLCVCSVCISMLSSGRNGITSVNRVPFPGSLTKWIVPSICSTSFFTIASPSPVPV